MFYTPILWYKSAVLLKYPSQKLFFAIFMGETAKTAFKMLTDNLHVAWIVPSGEIQHAIKIELLDFAKRLYPTYKETYQFHDKCNLTGPDD